MQTVRLNGMVFTIVFLEYCDKRVCLSGSVCLYARISQKPLGRASPNSYACMLRVTVIRFFSWRRRCGVQWRLSLCDARRLSVCMCHTACEPAR